MKTTTRLWLIGLLAAVLSIIFWPWRATDRNPFPTVDGLASPGSSISIAEARYFAQVVLATEYGDSPATCRRWVSSPTLYVENASSAHQALVQQTVAHLNQVLRDTDVQIEAKFEPAASAPSGSPHIRVIFTHNDNFAAIAKEEEIGIPAGLWGFCWIFWNADMEITRGVVGLPTNHTPADLQHLAIEEITQVLGLTGDSTEFDDSVFYENPALGEYGTALQLSPLDQKLLQFVYTHLTPGMTSKEIAPLLRTQW